MLQPPKCYVLVRRDIPTPDQVVQIGHACLKVGHELLESPDELHLVVLTVQDRDELEFYMNKSGAEWVTFDEPDDGIGIAAAASRPTSSAWVKKTLRELPLWGVYELE